MTSYINPFGGDVIQPIDVSYLNFSLTQDLVLSWPINGNIDGDYAARIMEMEPQVAGLYVFMPPANQVSVGQDALISNLGPNDINIVSYNGNAIVTIKSGKSEYIFVTDNTTVDGTWGSIDFGAATSASNAATLAGYGLLAIANTLNQSHPTTGASNGQVFDTTSRAKTVIWSGGSGSGQLDDAVNNGDNWFMLFKNNGSGTYTITCTGGQTIDNQSTKTFNPNESAFIICAGTQYVTVGYGVSNNYVFTALVKPVTNGTYTLTTSEAQSVIQEFVGTLSGNVTVIYPPVVGLYVISNQTTANGHTLTITTGQVGAANTTVPAGQQATVICDGINFYNANTVQAGATAISLINGSAANPSLNFASETNTGMFRPAPGEIGFAILGNQIITINSSGFGVLGTGNFTGGISGGVF